MISPIILIAITMIWIVVVILLWLTSIGHDIRSRGFKSGGLAMTVLHTEEIGFKAYFAKRDEHPVVDEAEAALCKRYRLLTIVAAVLTIPIIVIMCII